MTWTRWRVPVAVLLASVLAACTAFEDRQDEIDSITAAMRSVPGVARAEPTYVNSTSLGATFTLAVEVRHAISAESLEQAGGRFVVEVDDHGFPEYIVSLKVQTASVDRAEGSSGASFRLTDNRLGRNPVSADDVAGDLRLWAEAMQFPGVVSVQLSRPAESASEPGVNDRRLDIRVADREAGERLAARFPETSRHWRVEARPAG
ncbi:hypothetical protein H7I41_01685 [Mycobacterium manitobense]|uniref:Uncharacterized protein n=1 Tax=[Mycobacterium] manitobense TaxID=190147 RepID=A0A9X2YJI3_9MYCO|nr:hypothetical protein [[Mycobacterium] manitobense]MCV7168625.1 hypothetical protein [[Mycobacterium] manitobense]